MTIFVPRTTVLTVALAATLGGLAVATKASETNGANLAEPSPYPLISGSQAIPLVAWLPPEANYPPPRYYDAPPAPQYQRPPPAYNPAYDPRQLQAELAATRAELQRTTMRLEAAQQLLQQAREALTQNYAEHQQKRAGQELQSEQLRAATADTIAAQTRIDELTEQLQSTQTTLSQQQAKLADYAELETKFAQEQAATQQLRAESERLDKGRGEAESKVQSCQTEMAALNTRLDNAQLAQTTARQSLTDAAAERDRLQIALKDSTSALQAQEEALAKATTATSAAVTERDAIQAQLTQLQADNRALVASRQNATDVSGEQTAQLTKQLETAKASLETELAAKAAMQQTLAEAISTRERLLAQMDSLNTRLASSVSPEQVAEQTQAAQGELQQQLLACNERLVAAKAAIAANTTVASTQAIEPPVALVAPAKVVELAAMEPAAGVVSQEDKDADGVPDRKDLCPGSPATAAVDSTGCTPDMPIALDGVNFRYDSDALTNPSRAALDQVAAVLREQPSVRVEIAGHSDTQGNAAYNLWLSEQRAKSVMSYLVSQGVPEARLSAHGYGGSQPIADNTTREGLARNRRVELRRQP